MNKLKVLFLVISIVIIGFDTKPEKNDGFIFLTLYNNGRYFLDQEYKAIKPFSTDTSYYSKRLSSGIYMIQEKSLDFYSFRNFRRNFFMVSFEKSTDTKINILLEQSIFPILMNFKDTTTIIKSNDEFNKFSFSVGDEIEIFKSGITPRMIIIDSVGTYKLESAMNFPFTSNTWYDLNLEDIFYGTIKDSIIKINVGQALYNFMLFETTDEKNIYKGDKILTSSFIEK